VAITEQEKQEIIDAVLAAIRLTEAETKPVKIKILTYNTSQMSQYQNDIIEAGRCVFAVDSKVFYIGDGVTQLKNLTAQNDLSVLLALATAKNTPVSADLWGFVDSVTGKLRKISYQNFLAALKTYFDTLYAEGGTETATTMGALINNATSKNPPIDADVWVIRDSVSGLLQKVSGTNLKAYLKAYFDNAYVALAVGYSLLQDTVKTGYDNHLSNTTDAHGFLATIRGGVGVAGDDLKKLYDLIISIGQLVGDFDASSGALPTTGTGLSEAIDKGDYWHITVAGTLPSGLTPSQAVVAGDVLVARIANATVGADFYIIQNTTAQATASVLGIMKLYTDLTASNTDGSVTQAAINTALGFKQAVINSAAAFLDSLTAKTTPVDADVFLLGDSADSWFSKKLTFANLRAFLASSVDTLTNKRITNRVGSTTSSATPTINTDNVDVYKLTAQAADITSFTTNLSGTPTDWQLLIISITGTAARAITWGASFESSTITLPTTTVTTATLDVTLRWNAATSKWRCVGVA
jgi:hypothetical protein